MRLLIRNLTRGTVLAEAADVADTPKTRRHGLLKRDRLAKGEGLLITPCEGVHTFGMKFPIDVVYITGKRRVAKLRPEMRRGRISLCLWAHSVIELPAGTIVATRSERGDQLEFDRLE